MNASHTHKDDSEVFFFTLCKIYLSLVSMYWLWLKIKKKHITSYYIHRISILSKIFFPFLADTMLNFEHRNPFQYNKKQKWKKKRVYMYPSREIEALSEEIKFQLFIIDRFSFFLRPTKAVRIKRIFNMRMFWFQLLIANVWSEKKKINKIIGTNN